MCKISHSPLCFWLAQAQPHQAVVDLQPHAGWAEGHFPQWPFSGWQLPNYQGRCCRVLEASLRGQVSPLMSRTFAFALWLTVSPQFKKSLKFYVLLFFTWVHKNMWFALLVWLTLKEPVRLALLKHAPQSPKMYFYTIALSFYYMWITRTYFLSRKCFSHICF